MRPHTANPPRIGLAIDTSTSWGVTNIRGIHSYAAEHGGWELDLAPTGRYEALSWETTGQPYDGILARVTTRDRANFLQSFHTPIVNISSHDPTGGQIARCCVNLDSVGALAAQHFLERGFQSFGYITTSEQRDHYVDEGLNAYAAAIAEEGFPLKVFESPLAEDRHTGKASTEELERWLRDLPKPVGVLTWNSWEARRASKACRQAGIAIPEIVALLSAEYDDLSCSVNSPPLSSVDCSGELTGWHAAQLLDQLMNGAKPPKKPLLIEPRGILSRGSTDTLAINDTVVVEALAFIRQHALSGIRVEDVVREIPLSRRGLELRFQEYLSRSPAEEIRYTRVKHAREMLANTNFTIKRIAHAAAFANENLLARAFQHFYNETPSAYRRRIRLQGANL